MSDTKYKIDSVRSLVDRFFSLQWCRDHIVVPISLEPNLPPDKTTLTIAIGNIVYLGTVGNIIKERVGKQGIECRYIEKSSDEIQALLDNAANERFISGDSLDIKEFTEDAVLAALKESTDINSVDEFQLEFDDFEEEIESEIEDLSIK